MKIAVFGAGYVGLVVSAFFSNNGHEVICVEKDREKVENLKKGSIPIYEPGLKEVVLQSLSRGTLQFVNEGKEAIRESEVIFICVGTPSNRDGSADLSAVWEVLEEISQNLNGYKVVALKGTVPVGTGDKAEKYLREKVNVDFDVVSNPEFLREGSSLRDFTNPSRLIIGAENERAFEVMKKAYSTHLQRGVPVIFTDRKSAELIKYASNTFLALKVSFVNSIARLCDAFKANIEDVTRGLGLDPRIGPNFLKPGPGFGGSCLPKDIRALLKTCEEVNIPFPLVQAIIESNSLQKQFVVHKVKEILGRLQGKKIGVWGLAFKAGTDDIRESPAIEILKKILAEGKDVYIKAYDPKAMENSRRVLPQVEYVDDPYSACAEVDILLVLTEWEEFKKIDFSKVKELMRSLVIFDTRNILPRSEIESLGFSYYGLGRV
jgi:UDPglucose 6-dehydrogenase